VVKGDQNLLHLAFENLLSNAIKYTAGKSVATIEIGSRELPGNYAEIYISDNGAGFDMTYYNKLFGVFQRLHANPQYEGTGIGLANVKQIILKHKGSVWAEGKVNEGAVFYVALPMS
jgi:light-regulated signal transduction histidine kinase (bacteriophytochrome)